MIKKNKDIINFRFHSERALRDKVAKAIETRDNKEENNV